MIVGVREPMDKSL